jgi:sensor histidine kinase YesM
MHREGELIPLAQEMEIVRNYTYILKKRYGDNIHIVERLDNTSGLIAPLSIQLLVENAIKHNTVSKEKPLTIRISIDADWVTVQNAIQPKFQPGVESTGFGLSSLLARYTYLASRKIDISKEDNTFTVRIPVLYPDKTT